MALPRSRLQSPRWKDSRRPTLSGTIRPVQPEGPGPAGDHDDALEAQLSHVRTRLVRDAAEIGIEESAVLAAIESATAAYADATVRSFLPVLIERDVRRALEITRRSI
jgi:hypothetical protein